MRQVFPTYPLTRATRSGPFFPGYCRYFTLASRGAKHAGSAPGPLTSLGPATAPLTKNAARAKAEIPPRRLLSARNVVFTVVLPLLGRVHSCVCEQTPQLGWSIVEQEHSALLDGWRRYWGQARRSINCVSSFALAHVRSRCYPRLASAPFHL